jgi:hypothetical protein
MDTEGVALLVVNMLQPALQAQRVEATPLDEDVADSPTDPLAPNAQSLGNVPPGPSHLKEASDELESQRDSPSEAGLRLHSAVDDGTSATPSREHRASVCSEGQGCNAGLVAGPDPDPRWRFGNVRCSVEWAGGLQGDGRIGLPGRSRGDLCIGGVAASLGRVWIGIA